MLSKELMFDQYSELLSLDYNDLEKKWINQIQTMLYDESFYLILENHLNLAPAAKYDLKNITSLELPDLKNFFLACVFILEHYLTGKYNNSVYLFYFKQFINLIKKLIITRELLLFSDHDTQLLTKISIFISVAWFQFMYGTVETI